MRRGLTTRVGLLCAGMTAAAVAAVTASPARAQDVVYYDYLEDGTLTGGRLVIGPNDPRRACVFGLDVLPAERGTWPVTTIVDNGPTDNRVDLVMLGDGYTNGEMATYAAHVGNVLGPFFGEEPLAAYATYFNVHRVDVVSNESGVDEPDYGIYRDTALDMTYFCSGIPRLLCINTFKAAQAAASAPDVDQILALANSTRYGGAGYASSNLCTLAGANGAAIEIALHEFGHSFADLADEYDYGDGATYTGPEVPEPNASIYDAGQQLVLSTKWYRWLDLPNVNAFEGCRYMQYGLYRPTYNSKMRSLNQPFEQVNVEQFVLQLYFTVDPIDGASPDTAGTWPVNTIFAVDPLEPVDHQLDVQWSVDAAPVPGATSPTFNPRSLGLAPGLHTVSVEVVDGTSRVRDEGARQTWLTDSRTWTTFVDPSDLDGDGDVDLDDFSSFSACYNGASNPPAPTCPAGVDADLDDDGDVDLDDFAVFAGTYTGSL